MENQTSKKQNSKTDYVGRDDRLQMYPQQGCFSLLTATAAAHKTLTRLNWFCLLTQT